MWSGRCYLSQDIDIVRITKAGGLREHIRVEGGHRWKQSQVANGAHKIKCDV